MKSVILRAARFAADKHTGQTRRWTGAPYVLHPGRVAARATLFPDATEEIVAAAWLHDVVEDCGVSVRALGVLFGPDVANHVFELTNFYTKARWPGSNRAERKRMESERLARLPALERKVKLLDRIDNLGEVEPSDEFAPVYAAESEALLAALRGTDAALEDELAAEVQKLRRLCDLVRGR